jgi:hypothetical protein
LVAIIRYEKDKEEDDRSENGEDEERMNSDRQGAPLGPRPLVVLQFGDCDAVAVIARVRTSN